MVDIRHNLAAVQTRISSAAARSSRDVGSISLVAVSKLKSVAEIRAALEAGQEDFGENYVQELLQKQGEFLPKKIRWHFVGHLQTRKVRDLIGTVCLIHSLDSLKLALEIEKQSQSKGMVQAALIQVNLSVEPTKSGMKPEEVSPFLETVSGLAHLDVTGLMTLPPPFEDPEEARPFFRKLFELRERINREKCYRHPATELSMGMSHDFEVAIEEGSTIVRIGTALFGERAK